MKLVELIEKLDDFNAFIDTYKVTFVCYHTEKLNLKVKDIRVNDATKEVVIELEDD
jgi:hypothetical protein